MSFCYSPVEVNVPEDASGSTDEGCSDLVREDTLDASCGSGRVVYVTVPTGISHGLEN